MTSLIEHNSNEERIIIAFNTFFQGKVGSNENNLSNLEIG